jgi:hypothetical protein
MANQDVSTGDRELVVALAAGVLEKAAPEELVIFDETVEEFFADPDAVLNPKRRDEAVGFGIDLALLTPYVLAVAGPVVRFLMETVSSAAQDAAKPVIVRMVGRLFRRSDGEPGEGAAPLTAQQARRVRDIAYDRACQLGLPEGQCVLLADSVVGGILVSP